MMFPPSGCTCNTVVKVKTQRNCYCSCFFYFSFPLASPSYCVVSGAVEVLEARAGHQGAAVVVADLVVLLRLRCVLHSRCCCCVSWWTRVLLLWLRRVLCGRVLLLWLRFVLHSRLLAFQGGPLELDRVCVLRAGMEQRGGPGILSATHRPGHDGVAQKIPDHNADPVGVHANKDTAGENSPSIEAGPYTTPAISEHTRFRV